jgi:cell division FtsZ-interacting protein ZapD
LPPPPWPPLRANALVESPELPRRTIATTTVVLRNIDDLIEILHRLEARTDADQLLARERPVHAYDL